MIISNATKATDISKPIPRLLKRSNKDYSSDEDIESLKREILTMSKKKEERKAPPSQQPSSIKELQEKNEREEVAGRHKNDGQKHFKGAR
ncbi:hypothetical protein ACO0K7_08635 [Undibacterium sp. Ji67W]|uniref:hypothetical protein n=1 Tax=Undibacterium sp. Ji67W TaxID=3413042 RepID=UPI003BF21920